MTEIFRSRDCIVFFKDDALPVVVSQTMVADGWSGGQGVQWEGTANDELLVTYARGRAAGFLVWGSDEAGDDHTAITRNQLQYSFATMLFGSALIATLSFETYTINSRLVPPLVPLTYSVNDPLYFSIRGLWTKEDELTLTADIAAPSVVVGYCAQVPSNLNQNYLGVQSAI